MKYMDHEIEEIEQCPPAGLESLDVMGMEPQLRHPVQDRGGHPADVGVRRAARDDKVAFNSSYRRG